MEHTFRNAQGQEYTRTFEDNYPLDNIEKEGESAGLKRVKGWGEWAKDTFVPDTPVGWGVLLGSMAPGLGTASVLGRAGFQGGKLALTKGPMLARAASAALRVAQPVAGGAIGAGYEQLTQSPGSATSLSSGAFQGLLAGLGGEAGTVLWNRLGRTFFNRAIAGKDSASIQEFLKGVGAQLPQGAGQKEVTDLFMRHELAKAASGKMSDAVTKADTLSTTRMLQLPELGQYLENLGNPKYGRPSGDVFSPREAMDAFAQIGPELWAKSNKNAPSYRVLNDIRMQVLSDMGKQMGKEAASTFGDGLETYGLYSEVDRLLGSGMKDLLHDNGLWNFRAIQNKVMDQYSGPEGKWAQARLGTKYDDMIQTVFRGDYPTRDTGSVFRGEIPFTLTGAAKELLSAPKYAGSPMSAPPGIFTPAAGYGVAQGAPLIAPRTYNPPSVSDLVGPPLSGGVPGQQ